MIETIRRIGLFMIVAQTFMHLAAGKQYEKYMKIIAGVIVLLLFISPFSDSQGDAVGRWQQELERMTEELESRSGTWQETLPDMEHVMEQRVTRQLEEELQNRFNTEIQSENYKVTDVLIEWEEASENKQSGEQTMTPGRVRVTLRKTEAPDFVSIEKIQIGAESTVSDAKEAHLQGYRRRFTELLGIEEDRVEVLCDG